MTTEISISVNFRLQKEQKCVIICIIIRCFLDSACLRAAQETFFGLGTSGRCIDREFDRLHGRLGAQIVHARLEPLLPGIEVHAGELRDRRILDK